MTQTTSAPQLSDEAWAFIEANADEVYVTDEAVFGGDWGNWNWLFSEIWKRCKHD